jgi:conserved hypothetical protein
MIALIVVTIAVILKDYSVKELSEAVKSIHPLYLFGGISLMFFFAGCQGMNFYLIMRRLGHASSYTNCIEYAYIGNYFGAITPGASGGQPAQAYYMSKDKIHIDLSAITIFFIVFVSQIVIVLMGGVMVLLRYRILIKAASWFIYMLLAGTLVMLSLTFILSALMFSRKAFPFVVYMIIKLGKKVHLVRDEKIWKVRLDELLNSYQGKSKFILKHPVLFIQVFIATAFQWIAYCLVPYMVYLGFGYRQFDALDLMAGQAFINISVAAVPLPGSVGVAEKSFLNIYGLYFSQQDLPTAMILSRMINFYLPLLISFAVYLLAHHRIRKEK